MFPAYVAKTAKTINYRSSNVLKRQAIADYWSRHTIALPGTSPILTTSNM
jgi:hypothetical protein